MTARTPAEIPRGSQQEPPNQHDPAASGDPHTCRHFRLAYQNGGRIRADDPLRKVSTCSVSNSIRRAMRSQPATSWSSPGHLDLLPEPGNLAVVLPSLRSAKK